GRKVRDYIPEMIHAQNHSTPGARLQLLRLQPRQALHPFKDWSNRFRHSASTSKRTGYRGEDIPAMKSMGGRRQPESLVRDLARCSVGVFRGDQAKYPVIRRNEELAGGFD